MKPTPARSHSHSHYRQNIQRIRLEDRGPAGLPAELVSHRIFAYGSSGDCGLYGAPLAYMPGFRTTAASTTDASGRFRPARIKYTGNPADFVAGRLLELTGDELARLDSYAEHTGDDYIRFTYGARRACVGDMVAVEVFQLADDFCAGCLIPRFADKPQTLFSVCA